MRTIQILDALFPNTRQRVLSATLLHPDRWWYLSDLARHLGVTPSTLQRELASLVEAGILLNRKEGRMTYFGANKGCAIYRDLQNILVKTEGIAQQITRALQKYATHIECAFIYGSLARGELRADSDVDVMIVGSVGLSGLTPGLRHAERQIGRPVNASVYTATDLARKLQAGNHFLRTVMDSEKLFAIGNADDLEAVTRKRTGQSAPN